MMGLNPRRDRLCLVQICDSSNRFSLIQILPDQKEAPNLQKLFENPEITKIFHFARMDMGFLKAHLGIKLQGVFCTKIASKLGRTYTDKHGLKELIREFFDVNMDKGEICPHGCKLAASVYFGRLWLPSHRGWLAVALHPQK